MQISINIEVGDDTTADELAVAIDQISRDASGMIRALGNLRVDEERPLHTGNAPHAWQASIFRSQ